jgi:hypothetical protein
MIPAGNPVRAGAARKKNQGRHDMDDISYGKKQRNGCPPPSMRPLWLKYRGLVHEKKRKRTD